MLPNRAAHRAVRCSPERVPRPPAGTTSGRKSPFAGARGRYLLEATDRVGNSHAGDPAFAPRTRRRIRPPSPPWMSRPTLSLRDWGKGSPPPSRTFGAWGEGNQYPSTTTATLQRASKLHSTALRKPPLSQGLAEVAAKGTTPVIVVPLSRADRTSILPPRASSRSAMPCSPVP
jgi:hypothetical protein